MKHTGIELRISVNGDVTLQGDSDFLHYCAKYSGAALGDWSHVSAWPTCYGTIRVDVRAVELPDLDGELAELADVDQAAAVDVLTAPVCCVCGSADVAYHNYRNQPFCWPCADGHRPAPVELADNAAAPVPEVDTGAANLTELPTQDAPARPAGRRRPADLGIAIARIARRARSRAAR
jgi:hypothetical protein